MATMIREKTRDKKKNKNRVKQTKVTEPDIEVEERERKSSLPKTDFDTKITEIAEHIKKCDINEENQTTLKVSTISVDTNSNVPFQNSIKGEREQKIENIVPSAPLLEENEPILYVPTVQVREKVKSRVPCLPLEEAIQLFGGKEIAEVRAISEKEELIVEAGPQSKSDHPLIDLLSTFRTSLIAVDRERNRISCRYAEEEKCRGTLWKIQKRTLNLAQKCVCGANFTLRAKFDVAKLERGRLSAARLRLESLLQQVQDSYCHHQHTALQTHYDIDETINEILRKPKVYIREALALVFGALRLSDGVPIVYAQALQRWASILSTVLLNEDNLNHLLFVLHNLFRQARSVQWAGSVLNMTVTDISSAARLLGILELLLTRPVLESAQECTEETEAWEELDDSGEGCAVGEGRLRERDLLALLQALPLRDMVARLALFTRQEITEQSPEWWGDSSGGLGVLRACCGARGVLHVLLRARRSHAGYARLRRHVRLVAAAALQAIAALSANSRSSYSNEIEEKISAELEACFAVGFTLLEDEAFKLPGDLLSDEVAKEYCETLINGLHDKTVHISSLSVESTHTCGQRTRCVTHASLTRPLDRHLAKTVLDFLFQTGINSKPSCKAGCAVTARELLPQFLETHSFIHTTAFHTMVEHYRVDMDDSLLVALAPKHWRPTPTDVCGVLDEWALRCPKLLQYLLLHMDYTPQNGVSLESQLAIGWWVCERSARAGAAEWEWRALRALRLHRGARSAPAPPAPAPPAPAPPAPAPAPASLLRAAHALLATDWGHSVPLICGPGVDALHQLALARPLDALHCAALIMKVMAQSPESISLTPKFTDVFTIILNTGPTLIQRALGRRSGSGPELLQTLILEQLKDTEDQGDRSQLLSAWLHALWKLPLPAASRATLDVALRECRDWRALDSYSRLLLQEPNAKEYLADAVRNASQAPLLCESLLSNAHANELSTPMYTRLLNEIAKQKAAGQRIHVDNALKQIGCNLQDDELCVHRCACAALSAGAPHPAHALLWRLLLYMWLQRPTPVTAQPVGPLFFSGIVKSRTLAQLKKRIQEMATYHRNQMESLKASITKAAAPAEAPKIKKITPVNNNLFQPLTIQDFTKEPIAKPGTEQAATDEKETEEIIQTNDVTNLIAYHTGVEKMFREYSQWLDEGEKVRAYPLNADIAKYVTKQALDAAWTASLSGITTVEPSCTSPASPSMKKTTTLVSPPHLTHYERALAAITSVEDGLQERYKIPTLPKPADELCINDNNILCDMVKKYMDKLKKLTEQWQSEYGRLATLDRQLWELVEQLRVCRPLPPAHGVCPQGCRPVTVHIPEDEWAICNGAEKALRENRSAARALLWRAARPRPAAARVACVVHTIARRIPSVQTAELAAQQAWEAAPEAEAYAPARDAIIAFVDTIAQSWLNRDISVTCKLLVRWSGGEGVQQQLCGALVKPSNVPVADWSRLYRAVLALPLAPHVIFSYLTKFDMNRWGDLADASSRSEILESLINAAQKMGTEPKEQDLVLLEIIGVHSAAIVRASELREHVRRVSRACVANALPPAYCAHVPALATRARDLLLEQQSQVLHEFGVIWWEARSSTDRSLYAVYAPHFANFLYSMIKEFVAAAVRNTYGPERVAYCSWSAVQMSWSPWVVPHSTPTLLATCSSEYSDMVTRFMDTIEMIIQDCPGSDEFLLRHAWEWTATCVIGASTQSPTGDSQAQISALLPRLASLPWSRQWFRGDCLPLMLQISTLPDKEVRSWFGELVRHVAAGSWLRGVAPEQLPLALAALLALFTSVHTVLPAETLEQGCRLPWHRLPIPALDSALERYFTEHHNPALPYHQLPHFRVLLSACQLLAPAAGAGAEQRALGVAQWVRAATAPALHAHVRAHSAYLLDVLTGLASHITESELEALLSRALVVMCVQPADALALPVWEHWVFRCPASVLRACATAVSTLTTLDYFAALADAVAKSIMNEKEQQAPVNWREVYRRWSTSTWPASALVARARLHAAYAALHARAHAPRDLTRAFRALAEASIDFIENEVIVSVWICVACRAIWQHSPAAAGAGAEGAEGAGGAEGERRECAEAARALLRQWAERRRTLLQMVTLQSPGGCPTPQQQVLCRLALSIANPSEAALRALEAACSACGRAGGAAQWGPRPAPRALPALAARLLPAHAHCFAAELDLAPEH